jgi:hypothetical protein
LQHQMLWILVEVVRSSTSGEMIFQQPPYNYPFLLELEHRNYQRLDWYFRCWCKLHLSFSIWNDEHLNVETWIPILVG